MATFTYTTNIPNPPNSPSQDVGSMQTNTNSINSIINVDHFTFGSVGSKDGTHKQVTLTNENAPGVPLNTDGVFYSNGSFPAWQNVAGQTSFFAGFPSAAVNGYAHIQGGLILQWGRKDTLSFSDTIIFADETGLSFPNNAFNVLTVPFYNTTTGSVPTSQANITIDFKFLSKTQFVWSLVTNSAQYRGFFWFAIGN